MTSAPATAPDARTRILDAALALMGDRGVAGTSMRQLAAASGLNVATIYHYFPSKADVLRAVIAERRYGERLVTELPPVEPSLPPVERFGALFEWFWTRALEEESVWRLLVGEAIRGEPAAAATAAELVDTVGEVLQAWLVTGFPEVTVPAASFARVIQSQVFALVVEHLVLGRVTPSVARSRAEELAALAMG